MQSTIRLFKALPIEDKGFLPIEKEELNKLTIPKGFIFDGHVQSNYSDITFLIDIVNQTYGRDSKQLNQTFHKSFAKVRDASTQQLVFEQILHYLTTYGAEHLGVYNEESVYIPPEELNAPELKDGVRLVIIKGLTKAELKEKLLQLLGLGVALSEQTITDVLDVASFVGFDENDINMVKNKEVKVALYDFLNVVPSNPIEFLRFVVYKSTDRTLLIKNPALVAEIKSKKNLDIGLYFDNYEEQVGLQRLAEIFNRYKPIFLAFRTNTKMKKHVNKIRRLAKVNHKPMQEDLLNTITSRLESKEAPDFDAFKKALNDTNLFRKVRLAYALKFRITDADSILYRVRNGKSYAKEFNFKNKDGAQKIYDIIMKSIVEGIRPNVEGKRIFIPNGIKYSLPATEKQFTGNIPTGSYVEVPEDMVVGIHWENTDNYRVDLDLSISNNMGKIGWDSSYRDNNQDTQFSGDITDAPKPKGATEAFHIGKIARGSWLLNLNYYNYLQDEPVPFKIMVAGETPQIMDREYTFNPNNIIALSNSIMDVRQRILGIIVATEDVHRFYFAETDFQNGISSRHTNAAEQSRKYLLNFYTDSIVLNDVLIAAGADIVDADDEEVDINLSPEAIDKNSILELLKES